MNLTNHFISGHRKIPAIPTVSAQLTLRDRLGAWKVRWGIGRMRYTVTPGLYAVGKPTPSSPVLVGANYKLSFDCLRKELSGLHCWLLVLDTKGINVWCAAGKGTFGTKELVRRIEKSHLERYVSNKTLILPQLGAPGVSAHAVKKETGFSVIYGPIRAKDLPAFLANDCVATPEMRTVRFTLRDRLALTPMELIPTVKVSLMVLGALFLLNLCAVRSFGLWDFLLYAAAVVAGTVIAPALLPFIPVRSFVGKGWIVGVICTAIIAWGCRWFTPPNLLLGLGYMLALPAYTAYLTMQFTGSSTFASHSGVMKEMKITLPFIVTSLSVGIVLILIKAFTG